MKTAFIYALNCPITGRTRYVGKSVNPKKRMKTHLRQARKPTDHRTCWINSLLSAGHKPILEILDEVLESEWSQWEIAWIDFFREQGFDLVNGNAGGEGGHNPTPETRAKLSAAKRNQSDETRAKISATLLGRKPSDEARANQSAAMLGRKFSDETRAKISASKENISEEIRANMSAGQMGHKVSIETRAKLRAAILGKKRGPYNKNKNL